MIVKYMSFSMKKLFIIILSIVLLSIILPTKVYAERELSNKEKNALKKKPSILGKQGFDIYEGEESLFDEIKSIVGGETEKDKKEKAVQEKAAEERILPEKAVQEKAAEERILLEKAVQEKSAYEKALQEANVRQGKLQADRYQREFNAQVRTIYSIIVLIIFILLLFIGFEKTREKKFTYLLNRGSKPGMSIIRLFKGKKKRVEEFEEFSRLQKHHITELFDKAYNVVLHKNNTMIANLQGQLESKLKKKDIKLKDIEKENLEHSKRLDKFIQEKRNEIDDLKKQIQHEKDIYKKLETRHNYLGEWVKNR